MYSLVPPPRSRNHMTQYCIEYAVDIQHDIVVPKPDNFITRSLQTFGSFFVLRCTFRVLAAVQFNDQLGIDATEVSNKSSEHDLPPKLDSVEPAVSQSRPEFALCVRGVLPKSPRELTIRLHLTSSLYS
jgi:hypothetical protein